MITDIGIHPSSPNKQMTIEARALANAEGVLWLVCRDRDGNDARLCEVTLFTRDGKLAADLARVINEVMEVHTHPEGSHDPSI